MLNYYLKAILTAAIPLVAAVGLWVNSGELNGPELWIGGTGVVAAILVAIFPNAASGIQSATKFLAAALTPLVSFIIQYAVNGGEFDQAAFGTLVVGALTAVLIYASNNGNPPVTRPAQRSAN